MKKILLFTLASFVLVHAAFAQGLFASSWLIGLFGMLVLIMFAIFWLMKSQSSDIPMSQIGVDKSSPASTAHPDPEITERLKGMPQPKVHDGFFEVSSEYKSLPDEKIVVEQMRNKMDIVKKHGLPKKEHVDRKIVEAVDEILQEEFERREPEFRGEKKEPQLPAKYEAEKHLYGELEATPEHTRAKKSAKRKPKKAAAKKASTKKKSPKKKKKAKKNESRKRMLNREPKRIIISGNTRAKLAAPSGVMFICVIAIAPFRSSSLFLSGFIFIIFSVKLQSPSYIESCLGIISSLN